MFVLFCFTHARNSMLRDVQGMLQIPHGLYSQPNVMRSNQAQEREQAVPAKHEGLFPCLRNVAHQFIVVSNHHCLLCGDVGQLPFIDWLLWRIKWASIVLVCLSPDPLQPCKQCFKASMHPCILLVCFDYQANALVKHSQRWFLIQGFSSFHEAIFSIRPVS